MMLEKLYHKKIKESLNEERFIFNNKELGVRDSALTLYYLLKNNKAKELKPYIHHIVGRLTELETRSEEAAWCLWILGEYVNISGEHNLIEEYKIQINSAIENFSRNWLIPVKNWLGTLNEGVYLNNLAIIYGAVKNINNTFKSEKAQELLIEIRAFMFKRFLNQGKVVSMLGSKEVYGDISMIAVPFGLLDAGNQILVETIKVLENDLVTEGVRFSAGDKYFGGCVRSDLTCLMSWYYSEKGDIARAKKLLNSVENTWNKFGKLMVVDPSTALEDIYYQYDMENHNEEIEESYLSYILYGIARTNIGLKEKIGIRSDESICFIHNGAGNGNPYKKENTVRIPANPVKGEQVVVRMITQPFNQGQKAYIDYRRNDGGFERVAMKVEDSHDGERYWTVNLPDFEFGDLVEYRFVVEDGEIMAESESYQFDVRDWMPVERILNISKTNDSIYTNFSLPISSASASLEIKGIDEKIIKISFSNNKKMDIITTEESIKVNQFMQIKNKTFEFDTGEIHLNIFDEFNNNIIKSYSQHGESFIEVLMDKNGNIYQLRYKFLSNSDERFFGMGERYSAIEYRGKQIDNYVYNQYRDQGLKTYIPVPFVINSKGYGVFLDTSCYSKFGFCDRLSDLFEITIELDNNKQSLDTYLFFGKPKEILQAFCTVNEKPVLPPKWAFGPWMSSNNWDSQAETYKQLELTKQHEITATVLVLEQWSDEATFYIFNDAQYEVKNGEDYLRYEDYKFPQWGRWSDPKKMVEDLHNEGIKVLLWQAPVQRFMDGIAHGQRDEDERVMLEKGYHVKYKDGNPYYIPYYEWFKNSLVPDFTNPEAKEWWFNKRLYLLKDIGIDGFKTDGGECIYGADLLFNDGRTGAEMRNQYPNDYIGSYHELVKQYVSDGGVTFSRAGYSGAQKYPIHWAGDERSTYEAFRASVNAGLSCSMSGIPFWGWDLGGFNGEIPTAELYIRSTQMAVFCPIMQYHAETKGEFNRDRTPWNIVERTGETYVLELYKKYADLRMNLLPYIYQQAIYSSQMGLPMMKAMVVEYPDDLSCRLLNEQYIFGENLLVAPVMYENEFTKDIYFPEGRWISFLLNEDNDTGGEITGSRFMKVKAEIGSIPVFLKENSIIPLNLSDTNRLCSHVGNRVDQYVNLSFMMYINRSVDYTFEDDLNHEIRFLVEKNENDGCSFNIKITGNYSEPITLILRNYTLKKTIELDGKPLISAASQDKMDTNSYFTSNNDLFIRVENSKESTVVI